MTSIVIKDLSKRSELDQHAMAKVLGGAPREDSGLYLNPDKDLYESDTHAYFLPEWMEIHNDDGKTYTGFAASNGANMGAIAGSRK